MLAQIPDTVAPAKLADHELSTRDPVVHRKAP
jgi:hypothetical protein